ncbi:MAG TPA: acetyl-CoA carboxylase carboxyl transferase subunit alpha, partial [Methylophilaceae bacterium]|nr:acetyl-CoA carboxylase carboxyl transferase subunit alpha [Methylophilaceae bacterium]
ITAERLKTLGLVDQIIPEPVGGAHRDMQSMMETLKKAIKSNLNALKKKPMDNLLETRYARLMSYGRFKEAVKK